MRICPLRGRFLLRSHALSLGLSDPPAQVNIRPTQERTTVQRWMEGVAGPLALPPSLPPSVAAAAVVVVVSFLFLLCAANAAFPAPPFPPLRRRAENPASVAVGRSRGEVWQRHGKQADGFLRGTVGGLHGERLAEEGGIEGGIN